MGVGLFYGAFIFVGGLLALLLSTIAVAAASSLGGAYAVFWGEFLHIPMYTFLDTSTRISIRTFILPAHF